MKKTPQILLIITSSLTLAACGRKAAPLPPRQAGDPLVSPTPSPTPGRYGGGYAGAFSRSSQGTADSPDSSTSTKRGGFGGTGTSVSS